MTEVRQEIIRRMCEGESLRSICRTGGFPSVPTVIRWTHEDPKWAEQYARAREAQADALFDDLADVAEKALQAESAVEVAARRLVVDTHKWRLSKIVPRKYGEKTETAVTGGLELKLTGLSWLQQSIQARNSG